MENTGNIPYFHICYGGTCSKPPLSPPSLAHHLGKTKMVRFDLSSVHITSTRPQIVGLSKPKAADQEQFQYDVGRCERSQRSTSSKRCAGQGRAKVLACKHTAMDSGQPYLHEIDWFHFRMVSFNTLLNQRIRVLHGWAARLYNGKSSPSIHPFTFAGPAQPVESWKSRYSWI